MAPPATPSYPVGQEPAPTQEVEQGSAAPQRRIRNSCDACQEAKLGCGQEKPTCRRCVRHNQPCVYSPFRRIGRPRRSTTTQSTNATDTAKPRSKPQSRDKENSGTTTTTTTAASHDPTSSASVDHDLSATSCPVSVDHGRGPSLSLVSEPFNDFSNHFDPNPSVLDELDPFLNGQDFADLEPSFSDQHGAHMAGLLSKADNAMLDLQQSMQPRPNSSNMANVYQLEDAMTRSLNQTFPTERESTTNPIPHQERNADGPGVASTPGLTSGTSYIDQMDFDMGPSDDWSYVGEEVVIFPLIQNHQQGTRADNVSYANSPGPSPAAPTQSSCNKNCYPSLIQQLAHLNEHLSEGFKPSLDVILQVERDTRSLRGKILDCKARFHNRSIFLLLAVVIEQVMRLLETIAHDEGDSSFREDTNNVGRTRYDRGSGAPASYVSQCTLLVGEFEVDDETKASFIKRHLLFRLHRFVNMLTDLGQLMNNDLKDINLKTARDMLRDVFQRIELLRGVVELWE